MISTIDLLRNIGTFDSVDSGARLPLRKVAVIYAENGRGKTTLASIIRSLSSGDSLPVTERRRLRSQNPPHIVISHDGGHSIFQEGNWNNPLHSIVVFDDEFVTQNVCSGMKIETSHRRKLHELIIGASGVALNAELERHVQRIEQHNHDLRQKAARIPVDARGGLSVDEYCALDKLDGLDKAIEEGERVLAAGTKAEAIRQYGHFVTFALPRFDVVELEVLLASGLDDLQTDAAARVKAHIANLGRGGEQWVGSGVSRIETTPKDQNGKVCPFCAQDLAGSSLITHYQAYFSNTYREFRNEVDQLHRAIANAHSGEIQAAFERTIRICGETRQFWSEFLELPEISLDTAAIFKSWKAAVEGVLTAVASKQEAPLERITLSEDALTKINVYHEYCDEVQALSDALAAIHDLIEVVKERALEANIDVLKADLSRLKAIESRHTPEISAQCNDYIAERLAKRTTEQVRDDTRAALDEHRNQVFPTYGNAINNYLGHFGARFRLQNVTSINTRAGSSCNYSVLINNAQVPLQGDAGEPCFRNTLSSGDRNTLALAFFFASLERDPERANKVVIIDDPITSLDEHRSLTTIQELRRIVADVEQVIVLSHSKPFLCDIWKGTDHTLRSACRIVRDGDGSTLTAWDVSSDCITEHDRNHAMVTAFIESGAHDNERTVAFAIPSLPI